MPMKQIGNAMVFRIYQQILNLKTLVKDCDPSCLACSNPQDNNSCLSCSFGVFLSLDNACVVTCPPGSYPNETDFKCHGSLREILTNSDIILFIQLVMQAVPPAAVQALKNA